MMGVLNIGGSFIVAPVYRAHTGPYTLKTSFVYGGGVGISPEVAFNPTTAVAAAAIGIGRGLLVAETTLNQTWKSTTGTRNVIPLLLDEDINRVWDLHITGVAAYTTIDCNADSGHFTVPNITIDALSPYWSSDSQSIGNLTIGGSYGGKLLSDPVLSTTFERLLYKQGAGWVQASSLVSFIMGNNTIEGAQTHLKSTNPKSRIQSVDILTCNSTTLVAVSKCSVQYDNGSPRHNLTTCTQIPTKELPPQKYTTPGPGMSVLDDFITNPYAFAGALSTAPIWSLYWMNDRLPAYDHLHGLVQDGLVPYPYTTTAGGGDTDFTLPQSYIKDILFGTAQHSLTQGTLRVWSDSYNRTSVTTTPLRATFGTSRVALQITILVVAFLGAALATITAIRPSSRNAADLDIARLISIAQNSQLESVFGQYSDRAIIIPRQVQNVRLRYESMDGQGRKIVVVDEAFDAPLDTLESGTKV